MVWGRFVSHLIQRLGFLPLFRLARAGLWVLVTAPRVETRHAALGTLKVGSEVGEAKRTPCHRAPALQMGPVTALAVAPHPQRSICLIDQQTET